MRRTQILLTPEQHAELTAWAEQEGRSLSAVLRQIVDRALQQGPSPEREAWVKGLTAIRGGGTPVPETDQDRVLYEEEGEA